jgi:hypothetical protein
VDHAVLKEVLCKSYALQKAGEMAVASRGLQCEKVEEGIYHGIMNFTYKCVLQ